MNRNGNRNGHRKRTQRNNRTRRPKPAAPAREDSAPKPAPKSAPTLRTKPAGQQPAPARPAGSGDRGSVLRGYLIPGLPHPLLAPERNPGWQSIRNSMERVRREIEATGADLLLIYSTQWLSVIGHQIQADPEPQWRHVDPEWHDLGDMPYRFSIDAAFAEAYRRAAEARGLHARTVAYHGFPIDTGTVTALQLLNPDNRIAASAVSCNMYADRAETLVLGKAARDAVQQTGRRAVALAVSALSNRYHTQWIDPKDDHISSLKDDEWNRKVLEILAAGRLEDISQLARQFSLQANGDQKLKAMWWLAAFMGQHNNYAGEVIDYQPIWGTGAAVVRLVPIPHAASNLEFDEEEIDTYLGDRNVLDAGAANSAAAAVPAGTPGAGPDARVAPVRAASGLAPPERVHSARAPKPVGAYPHARRAGNLVYLSGIGPRQVDTDEIPGGPVRDRRGKPRAYDVAAQTLAVIENVRRILEDAGSSLDRILDVTVFLIDMDRDFETFNSVYREHFEAIGATRTTVEVRALPTPIAVEFKVIATCDG